MLPVNLSDWGITMTRDYTSEELERMPTLCVGQDADLKVERTVKVDGHRIHQRWWLSRMELEDGETHRVHLEERTDLTEWEATKLEPLGEER